MLEKSEKKSGKVLGIDWGSSFIGLAVADCEAGISFCYDTIKNDKNILGKIREIVEMEDVSVIVVGFSKTNNNSNEGIIRKFGEKIKKSLKIKVFYTNELFTTQLAKRNIIASQKGKVKKYDNEEAARIMLQEWLDYGDNVA